MPHRTDRKSRPDLLDQPAGIERGDASRGGRVAEEARWDSGYQGESVSHEEGAVIAGAAVCDGGG